MEEQGNKLEKWLIDCVLVSTIRMACLCVLLQEEKRPWYKQVRSEEDKMEFETVMSFMTGDNKKDDDNEH